MRFQLRLRGRTASGQECLADITVYGNSQKELQEQAESAATTAAWMTKSPPYDPIPEGSHITVEGVETI